MRNGKRIALVAVGLALLAALALPVAVLGQSAGGFAASGASSGVEDSSAVAGSSAASSAEDAPQGAGISTGLYLVFAISGGMCILWFVLQFFKGRRGDGE